MVLENIAEFAKGGAFVLGGVGVIYLSKYLPENIRPIGYVGAAGLGAFGLYSIYKAFRGEEPGEPPQPGEEYPMQFISPTPGEVWSWSIWHTTEVRVWNNYNVRKRVYVGLSYIEDETGIVFDYDVRTIDIDPGLSAEAKWRFYGRPDKKQKSGLFWVVSSVWNRVPWPGCEETGECFRLGTAESDVTFTLFG